MDEPPYLFLIGLAANTSHFGADGIRRIRFQPKQSSWNKQRFAAFSYSGIKASQIFWHMQRNKLNIDLNVCFFLSECFLLLFCIQQDKKKRLKIIASHVILKAIDKIETGFCFASGRLSVVFVFKVLFLRNHICINQNFGKIKVRSEWKKVLPINAVKC